MAALAIGALSGVGGAIAILLVLIVDGKLDSAPHDKQRLLIASLSTIAGFIGFTVLNSLARGLEKRLEQQEKNLDSFKTRVDEEITDQGIRSAQALGLSTANQAASGDVVPEDTVSLAVEVMTEALQKHPLSRRSGIILARLYRWCKDDLTRGIDILSSVLEARRLRGLGNDEDAAAVMYNRACYYSVAAGKETDPAQVERLKSLAFRDLRAAATADPSSVSMARTDEDFDPIRTDSRFNDCFA